MNIRFDCHFEPEQGWMNDPNGLCHFGGRYHAFFQYNPHAPHWGTMHWGHAASEDLVHWRQAETALFPDMDYENEGGCFSGSALEVDGELHLFYTAVSREKGQTQAAARSRDWTGMWSWSGMWRGSTAFGPSRRRKFSLTKRPWRSSSTTARSPCPSG